MCACVILFLPRKYYRQQDLLKTLPQDSSEDLD